MACDVEGNSCLGVETHFLIVINLGLGSCVNHEVRFEVSFFFSCRLNEHVSYKVCLPGYFHNEADSHTCIFICTAECINYIELLVGEFFKSQLLQLSPVLFRQFMIVIRIFRRIPPDSIFGVFVHDNVLILRRTACINTCHNIDGTKLCQLTFFVTCQFRFHLFLKQ